MKVDVAADLTCAETLLRAEAYDAVVADLRLSGADSVEGLTVLSLARELHPSAALVLLTAYGDARAIQRARECGTRAVLHKPVPLARVEEALFAPPHAQESP